MTTRGARKALESLEAAAAATLRPMGTQYRAMRDLAVLDATGQRVEVKRGELLSRAFLNAPRVDVMRLCAVRCCRQEFVET